MSFFPEEFGNWKKSNFFVQLNWQCQNTLPVQILLKKILTFEQIMPFSVFIDLQRHWPGFTNIVVDTFQKKAVRAFEFCYSMPYMMYFKVTNHWVSGKIISMCKTEYAEDGAKLHRVKLALLWTCQNLIIKICGLCNE